MTAVLTRGTGRQAWVAIRALAALTVATVLYTLLVTAVGQLVLPAQANGSLVRADGRVIGSALIGQSFTTPKGAVLPQWFQSRPSAAGAGYDAAASSPSNLGPDDPALGKAIRDRRSALAAAFAVPAAAIPPDALTASGSGLDPAVSPAYARLQVASVARARHLPQAEVARLVEGFVQGPDLGYLGAPTVDVLALNAALAKMDPAGNG
ncbi:potassium-transporting ATPase subunit KdpC [Amnibacterium sp.]|uniref:potassium-transporting ATPase subunit KdpC n=1 Tax=Amnibacterium sp. TaxID=1872496 RepID=UPI002632BBA5|nr:potassium-transporting ATPase subunit KdpC [Amnibacterium sp.]MCU1472972.1 kdpC [Amnibacterium sp.]